MLVIASTNDRSPWHFQRLISVTASIKYMSGNFDIGDGDPRSGHFATSPLYIGQWEKIERRLFWTKTIRNTLKHRVTGGLYTLNRNIAISDPSTCRQGHQQFFRKNLLWRQTSDENYCCVQADDTDRLIGNMTFSNQIMTMNLSQISNMTF